MRMAFLPVVLLLGGGVAMGQNPATSAVKASDQAQLRAEAVLQAQLRKEAAAAEQAALQRSGQLQILTAQIEPAPLTLLGNSEPAASSGPEPIPTQWPKVKAEPIPTHWHAYVILVGGRAAPAAKPSPEKNAGGTVAPK